MNIKKIAILSLILALLIVGIYVVDKKEEKKEESKNILNVKTEDVLEVSFYDGKDKIKIVKENDIWKIKKPIETTADEDEIERILSELSPLSAEKIVEKDAKDLKKYGLKDSLRKFSVKLKSGKTYTIVFGDKGPLENSYYVMLEGSPNVFLVAEFKKNNFIKTLFDLRNKKFGVFDVDKITKIEVENNDSKEKYVLIKKGEDWYLKEPKKFIAKNTKVEDMLYSLKSLEAKDIVKDNPEEKDLKEYSLDNPLYRFKVFYGKNSIEYLISKKDDKWYAYTKNSGFIGEVNDYSLSDLKVKYEELKEMKVAKFDGFNVNYLMIEKGKDRWEFVKDKNDTWRNKNNKKMIIDDDKITDFIDDIESLEADKIIDEQKPDYSSYGLDKPQVKIVLKEEDGKEVKIYVGKKDGEDKVFLRNGDYSYIYRVSSDFLDKIPEKIEDWEKKVEDKKEVEK